MTSAIISAEDRQAIYDNLNRYAWCLDQADGAGVASTFTSDGAIVASDGRYEGRSEIERFVNNAGSAPGFFGRQHHVQPLFIEEKDGGYLLTSYWMVVTWHAGEAPFIVYIGYYLDTCVRDGDTWRMREKIIRRWNNATAPPMAQTSP